MRTVNPPAPVGTAASSSASDQVTVTVGPALSAASAVGSTPSTVRAGSAATASWPNCTVRLPATVTMELPVGVESASAGIAIPSLSSSPATISYSKRSVALSAPET